MLALVLVPLAAAVIAFATPSERARPWIVAAAGAVHLAGALRLPAGETAFGGWFGVDPLGHLILIVVSALFALCSVYGIGYLRVRAERPNRAFCVCLLTFLAMTTTIALSQHLAVMWVAVEGATLSTAVLIYFNHNARSLEAAWKYLMIGSVGIAIATIAITTIGNI